MSATSSWEPLHTTIAISISQRKVTFCLPCLLSRWWRARAAGKTRETEDSRITNVSVPSRRWIHSWKTDGLIAVGGHSEARFKSDAMASRAAALRLKAKSRGTYSQPSTHQCKGFAQCCDKSPSRGSMDSSEQRACSSIKQMGALLSSSNSSVEENHQLRKNVRLLPFSPCEVAPAARRSSQCFERLKYEDNSSSQKAKIQKQKHKDHNLQSSSVRRKIIGKGVQNQSDQIC